MAVKTFSWGMIDVIRLRWPDLFQSVFFFLTETGTGTAQIVAWLIMRLIAQRNIA
jgi:hypothetical protein